MNSSDDSWKYSGALLQDSKIHRAPLCIKGNKNCGLGGGNSRENEGRYRREVLESENWRRGKGQRFENFSRQRLEARKFRERRNFGATWERWDIKHRNTRKLVYLGAWIQYMFEQLKYKFGTKGVWNGFSFFFFFPKAISPGTDIKPTAAGGRGRGGGGAEIHRYDGFIARLNRAFVHFYEGAPCTKGVAKNGFPEERTNCTFNQLI